MRDFRIITGDCVDVLRSMPDRSVDAIVTDPPYGIGFMGREWDQSLPGPELWAEALRIMKPGAHLVAFAACRTVHRLAVMIEDVGFTIRDQIAWMQWQGFPKSMDIAKALETEPEMVKRSEWRGWGTALKPAHEPAILARAPLDGTIASTVRRWGTGALNIEDTRIPYGDPAWPGPNDDHRASWSSKSQDRNAIMMGDTGRARGDLGDYCPTRGRWPANIYYEPKASQSEKQAGCYFLEPKTRAEVTGRKEGSAGIDNPRAGSRSTAELRNHHPTVKPIKLMAWLWRLVTPPGGLVLDPFTGSGSTGIAALRGGFRFVGGEIDPEYAEIARARIRFDAPLLNREVTD